MSVSHSVESVCEAGHIVLCIVVYTDTSSCPCCLLTLCFSDHKHSQHTHNWWKNVLFCLLDILVSYIFMLKLWNESFISNIFKRKEQKMLHRQSHFGKFLYRQLHPWSWYYPENFWPLLMKFPILNDKHQMRPLHWSLITKDCRILTLETLNNVVESRKAGDTRVFYRRRRDCLYLSFIDVISALMLQ